MTNPSYCQRIKSADELNVGDRIYYTGDMANLDWWGTITDFCTPDMVTIQIDVEAEGFTNNRHAVAYWNIGKVYKGHGDPRFYTKAAVDEFDAARMARFRKAFGLVK